MGGANVKRHARDGSVSKGAAYEFCCSIFKSFDPDGDGFITQAENAQIATQVFGMTDAEAEQQWQDILAKMDTNGDGQISEEEYVTYWLGKSERHVLSNGDFEEDFKVYLRKVFSKI